jgi:hypothetical protein
MHDDNHNPPAPAELRKQAARARDLAQHLIGDGTEQRLLELAGQLEARAAAMDSDDPCKAGHRERRSRNGVQQRQA